MEGHPELTASPPFRRLGRRWWTTETWDRFWTAATVCLFIAAGALVADRIRLELSGGGQTPFDTAVRVAAAVAGLLSVAAVTAAVAAWSHRPSPMALALAVDARTGSAEAIATALDLDSRDNCSPFRPLVDEAARETLQAARPAAVFPWPRVGSRAVALLPLAIALWIGSLPIPGTASEDTAAGRTRPPPVASDPPASSRNPTPPDRKPSPPKPPKPPDPAKPDVRPGSAPTAGAGAGDTDLPGPDQPPEPRPNPRGAGDATAEELFGDPTRTEVKKRPKTVDPLIGEGATKSRDLAVNLPDESPPPGDGPGVGDPPDKPVPAPYPSLYRKYAKVAEDAAAGERIPAEDRDLVRRYFEAIRPK